MNSLSQGPIAELLDKLHHDAMSADRAFMTAMIAEVEKSGQTFEQAAAKLIADERADYRATYRVHADHFLSISPNYGHFLYSIARTRRATRIVEFGTSMGLSTIYLATALRDNGGGKLIGSELEPTKVARARVHIAAAGLSDFVEIREGDALETLSDVGDNVDVLLVDGAWSLYLPVLKMIEPHLAPGAAVLGENAFAQDYLDYVRAPANGYISQALAIDEGRGNEFSIRTAA